MRSQWPRHAGWTALALLVGCDGGARDIAAAVERSRVLVRNARHAEAIQVLDSVLARRPSSADALKLRGNAYRGMGDPHRAILDYDQALAIEPSNSRVVHDRGAAFQDQLELERALQDFSTAIRLDSTYALAWKDRGRTHFYLGRLADAAADTRRGLALDSTNLYVAIWLHFMHARLGVDDRADFARHAALSDSVRWPGPVARYFLGRLTEAQFLAAADDPSPQLQREQRCAAAYFVGQMRMTQAQPAAAVSWFTRAAATCPHYFTEYRGATAELRRMGAPVP